MFSPLVVLVEEVVDFESRETQKVTEIMVWFSRLHLSFLFSLKNCIRTNDKTCNHVQCQSYKDREALQYTDYNYYKLYTSIS